jgi:hypothetical protein
VDQFQTFTPPACSRISAELVDAQARLAGEEPQHLGFNILVSHSLPRQIDEIYGATARRADA